MNILPWPVGDPDLIHSHVTFDAGATWLPRNHVGAYVNPDIRLSSVVAQPEPEPESEL